VVWNIFYFSIYWEIYSHLTYIFKGVKPPTRLFFVKEWFREIFLHFHVFHHTCKQCRSKGKRNGCLWSQRRVRVTMEGHGFNAICFCNCLILFEKVNGINWYTGIPFGLSSADSFSFHRGSVYQDVKLVMIIIYRSSPIMVEAIIQITAG
jgi:hypothetical protein